MANFDDALNDMLGRAEKDAQAKVDAGTDKGHTALLEDLRVLTMKVKACEFHDMLNAKYAMPKVALAEILMKMRDDVVNGKYDND